MIEILIPADQLVIIVGGILTAFGGFLIIVAIIRKGDYGMDFVAFVGIMMTIFGILLLNSVFNWIKVAIV